MTYQTFVEFLAAAAAGGGTAPTLALLAACADQHLRWSDEVDPEDVARILKAANDASPGDAGMLDVEGVTWTSAHGTLVRVLLGDEVEVADSAGEVLYTYRMDAACRFVRAANDGSDHHLPGTVRAMRLWAAVVPRPLP